MGFGNQPLDNISSRVWVVLESEAHPLPARAGKKDFFQNTPVGRSHKNCQNVEMFDSFVYFSLGVAESENWRKILEKWEKIE